MLKNKSPVNEPRRASTDLKCPLTVKTNDVCNQIRG